MISSEMKNKVMQVLTEYWHYNDEGRAYTPESYTKFMAQMYFINRKYRKNGECYEEMVKRNKQAGEKADPVPAISKEDIEYEDSEAELELCRLYNYEKELVQVCDPAEIKVELWDRENTPDMRKNGGLQIICSDQTSTVSLDGEGYMPGFVPYLLEDGEYHPMIIVAAGGQRSNYSSGDPVCRFFNEIGYHSALLGHRVGPQKLNFCLDLQRTVRLIRSRSSQWKVYDNKIGAIGLSFGGVVIADYIEQLRYSDKPSQYDTEYRDDEIDCLPGELNAFLGAYTSSDPFLERSDSLDYSQYPPTFLVLPGADPLAGFQVSYLNDLVRHGVRAEAHLFDGGVHGFGMGDSKITVNGAEGHIPSIELWPRLAQLWLERIFR